MDDVCIFNLQGFARRIAGQLNDPPACISLLLEPVSAVMTAKIGGRARKCRGAELSEPRLDRGRGKSSVDVLVELFNNLCWRALRCANTEPGTRLIVRHELGHGWNVGQCLPADAFVTANARSVLALMYSVDPSSGINMT